MTDEPKYFNQFGGEDVRLDNDQHLIWWLDQSNAELIFEQYEFEPPAPEYLREEFMSRYGRPGRGRLWVPDFIEQGDIEWDETKPAAAQAGLCGGIVFLRRDISAVRALPGFVTDTKLNYV